MVCHYMTVGMQVVHEQQQRYGASEVVLTGPFATLHPDLLAAAVNGVAMARRGETSPRDHHNRWVDFLTERGWQRGPKDPAAKRHPGLVYWDDGLPVEDKDKARMFLGTVMSMTIDAGQP